MNYGNYNNNNNNGSHGDWNFMDYTSHGNSNHSNLNEPLQEPVAFEDFQFSMGLDPEFAMPIPLDMPPPPPLMTENDLFAVEPVPTPINHAVLDEQDHKAFSQFLDQFFVDPNMQIDTQYNMYEHQPPPPMSLDTNTYHHPQDEFNRQTNILQSLDEQKRYFNSPKDDQQQQQERPGAVYLQKGSSITAPYIKPVTRESSSSTITVNSKEESPPRTTERSNSAGSGGAIRRGKPHKELLTEEEKRSNHIASEQKRRSMIRSGFKDLTEIVPTLKNINNSKSTVLFKAVDYIKYLDKRNRNLREKIKNLEVRVEVEGRMGALGNHSNSNNNNNSRQSAMYTSSNYTTSSMSNLRDDHLSTQQQQTNTKDGNMVSLGASAALLQHKTQQKQLMELQEKLQLHQKMLAQQQQQQQQRRMYEQQSRWNNEKSTVETKMEVDPSTNESLKATVSA